MPVDEKYFLGYTYLQKEGLSRKRTDNIDKSEKTAEIPFKLKAEQKYIQVAAETNDGKMEVSTMCVKDIEVKNQVGLHARPATFFIQKANEYKSSIWVEKEERRVNAKSLLGILSLGIVGGAKIRIIADGSDEQLAIDGLVKLVDSEFAE